MTDSPTPAEQPLPFVQLFTDGACRGNPGPGGWAYILKHPATSKQKEAWGGAHATTNNQMELQAAISGLESLSKPSRVEVITDSEYVANGATKWLVNWKRNNWLRKESGGWKPVKNVEYWQRLDQLLTRHKVSFTVVRGHSGHPENERCDELAVMASMQFGVSP